MFERDRLQESQLIDTAKEKMLMKYGIKHTVYPHNGFYPRALQAYVEGFGFRCLKLYTIQFPNKLRKVAGLGESLRGELILRQFPLVRCVGKTVIALFEAV
jgi:hypothetical protein